MKKAKVFLDTNILLKSFLSFRKFKKGEIDSQKLPFYLIDNETEKYTFEKCIYESYLAFKGVGGKKPDEGRGDWADRFLKEIEDPQSIAKLISKFHSDNKEMAFFWSNHILEVDPDKLNKEIDNVISIKNESNIKEIENLKELKENREYFEMLCNEFNDMLKLFGIEELSYLEIFSSFDEKKFISFQNPYCLDTFVRDTTIPSEDFEIVFAAERIGTNIFITDDKRLITCSKSLGFNFFLTPGSFCTSEEYQGKKLQWKAGRMISNL